MTGSRTPRVTTDSTSFFLNEDCLELSRMLTTELIAENGGWSQNEGDFVDPANAGVNDEVGWESQAGESTGDNWNTVVEAQEEATNDNWTTVVDGVTQDAPNDDQEDEVGNFACDMFVFRDLHIFCIRLLT